MYKGIAKLSDGRMLEVNGTLAEVASWADNLIRSQDGDLQIDIKQVEG